MYENKQKEAGIGPYLKNIVLYLAVVKGQHLLLKNPMSTAKGYCCQQLTANHT